MSPIDDTLLSAVAEILSGEDVLGDGAWAPNADDAYRQLATTSLELLSTATELQEAKDGLRPLLATAQALEDVRFEARLSRAARDIWDAWQLHHGHGPTVPRSIDVAGVQEHLVELNSLQNALVQRLEEFHGPLETSPARWPQRDSLELDGSRWAFIRHGLGFRFEELELGLTVEAHDRLETRPVPLDHWRSLSYLSSMGLETICADSEEHALSEGALEAVFPSLVESGSWTVEVEPYGRRLYWLRC